MINSTNFLTIIGNNYTILKRKISFWCYRNKQLFNEDVYHNTIIKCNDNVIENNLTFRNESEAFGYIFSSYKNNNIRDKLYSDNKPKKLIKENTQIDTSNNIIDKCDMSIIKDTVVKKFGEDAYNILIENADGKSIVQLQNEYKIKNMKAKIRSMKDFICEKILNKKEQ